MIKDFLILNCIGKNDKIGIKIDNKFYIHDFDQKVNKNDHIVVNILNLVKKHKVNINSDFSILINNGPGSFSSIRVSLAIAKGIKILKRLGFNKKIIEAFIGNIHHHEDEEDKVMKEIIMCKVPKRLLN